jgi:hypothetical protein
MVTGVCLVIVGVVPVCSVAASGGGTRLCPNEALIGFRQALPDCRAYEMVTPSYKEGFPVSNPEAISADGERITAWSLGVFAGAEGPALIHHGIGIQYEFARTAGGWQASALSPANPSFLNASSWYLTSEDAATSLFSMPTAPVGQDDLYTHSAGGPFVDVGPITPPADGPTVGPAPEGSGPSEGDWEIIGASSDLSRVVLALLNPQTSALWPFDESVPGGDQIYQYRGTRNTTPELVAVNGGAGSHDLISQCGSQVGGTRSKFNAVSADGETIFVTPFGADTKLCGAKQPPVETVYARRRANESIALSVPSPTACTVPSCLGAPAADALFEGASKDGSKAFFTSTQQLMDSASEDAAVGDSAVDFNGGTGCPGAHESGCNLYEYDFANSSDRRLVLVSGGSPSPQVQGVVRISSDGSHVYFVAQGVLTSEPNVRGQTPAAGEDNLYVYERDPRHPSGKTTYVATLVSSDRELWSAFDAGRPAQVTPNGDHLVFQSHADLTADDTSTGVWQVFEYDAQANTLVRISRGESGFNNDGNTSAADATIPHSSYGGSGFAGQQPQPLALSDDGSFVWFQTSTGLTPTALNDVPVDEGAVLANNVYEYHEGHVYMISSGKDASSSRNTSNIQLIGGSASGRDVFFQAGEPLLPSDTDTQIDTYDARSGGGFSQPPASVRCSGEACLGALSAAPAVQAAGSEAQQAGGNLAPSNSPQNNAPPKRPTPDQVRRARLAAALRQCRAKRNRRHRRACEVQVHRRFHARTTVNRGARK